MQVARISDKIFFVWECLVLVWDLPGICRCQLSSPGQENVQAGDQINTLLDFTPSFLPTAVGWWWGPSTFWQEWEAMPPRHLQGGSISHVKTLLVQARHRLEQRRRKEPQRVSVMFSARTDSNTERREKCHCITFNDPKRRKKKRKNLPENVKMTWKVSEIISSCPWAAQPSPLPTLHFRHQQ